MAVSSSSASLLALTAVILTVFSLIGTSLAAEAPAPGPSSPAVAVSPSVAAVCLAAVCLAAVTFLFGSALKF